MSEPLGSMGPRYFQGPAREGELARAMLPFVDRRNHVPSDSRLMMEGSWIWEMLPEIGSGEGYVGDLRAWCLDTLEERVRAIREQNAVKTTNFIMLGKGVT